MKDFKKHLDFVRETLRNDKELYDTYQANIAMSIIDEAKLGDIHFPQLPILANEAAKRFLNAWIKE